MCSGSLSLPADSGRLGVFFLSGNFSGIDDYVLGSTIVPVVLPTIEIEYDIDII